MSNPVTSKEDVIRLIISVRSRLAELGVASLGLFGSFARGQQTAASDVDILIEFAAGKVSFDNFMDVSFLLEGLLGRRIELVTPEALNPRIGPHILREVERVPIAA